MGSAASKIFTTRPSELNQEITTLNKEKMLFEKECAQNEMNHTLHVLMFLQGLGECRNRESSDETIAQIANAMEEEYEAYHLKKKEADLIRQQFEERTQTLNIKK